MRTIRDFVLAALITFTFLFAGLTLGEAQEAPHRCPERSDELILAMLTVHEAGWYAENDMRSIHAVLTTLAANWHVSFAEAACRHSRRLLTGRTSRIWASELDEAGTAPAHWPTTIMVRDGDTVSVHAHPAWANYVERWRNVLDLARNVLARRPASCEALTWGGRIDFDPERRRRRLSSSTVWVETPCVSGETRNHYGYWAEVDAE